MKKTISFILFSLFAFASIGQTGNHSKDWAQIEVMQKANKIIGDDISSNVEGSLYHLDSYLEGTLLFEGKELERNMLYRYEAYSDVIEVKLENGEEDILAKSPKLDILIGNDLYSYVQFYDKSRNEMDFGYMVILDKNENYNLYDRKIKKLITGKKAKTTMTTDLEAKLLDDETIYFRLAGDKFASRFPDSKNSLYKMFPNQKSELKKFLKNENIDLENPQDAAKLLDDETIYFRLAGDKFASRFPDSKNSLYKMFPNQKSELKMFLKNENIDLENPQDAARVLEFCL